jgi:hypothetical protein
MSSYNWEYVENNLIKVIIVYRINWILRMVRENQENKQREDKLRKAEKTRNRKKMVGRKKGKNN